VVKKTNTKVYVFRLPVFFILFITYSIAMGLVNDVGWLLLGFIAFVLDLITSPVYTKTNTTTEETE